MRLRIVYAAPQLDPAHAGIAQNALRFVDGDVIEEKIRRQIAARHDHPLRQIGNLRGPANQLVELRVTVRFRIDSKRRAIERAPEPVANMQRVVRPDPLVVDRFADREQDRDLHCAGGVETPLGVDRQAQAGFIIMNRDGVGEGLALAQDASLVHRFADRQEDRDLYRAGCVKTTICVYRKTKTGLVVMDCDRVGHRLALAQNAFAFGSERFGFRFVVHDGRACYLQRG